ncbi:MAG TPA: transglycosylase domain-containing protein [Candidatus Polarisedimenticolia bacterium]|nr:transglycosylase domain-containing protein [Candidatus Polarisedimenticolia bacterium]
MKSSPSTASHHPSRSPWRSWWGRTLLACGLLLLVIALHYTRVVLQARVRTPDILEAALADPAMVLSPDDLAAPRLRALLAVQDPRFFEHKGWDFGGGRITTITQALVKCYYFHSFRPGISKIRQSLIARFTMDPLVSKEDQLTLFLNTVYLGTLDGRAVNGLADGAQVFFGRPFAELSWDEYLALLACFSAPDAFNPRVNPMENARQVEAMKHRLAGLGIVADVPAIKRSP